MAKCPATQLSLEYLRGSGVLCDIVERNIPMKPFPKKHDMFNLFDIVGLDGDSVIFVQTTSKTNLHGRLAKMRLPENREAIRRARCAGVWIYVHAWYRDKKKRYQLRVVEVDCNVEVDAITYRDITDGEPTLAAVRAQVREQERLAAKRER